VNATLADLRRWDPAGLHASAVAVAAARDRLHDLRTRLVVARPGEQVWRGVAAEQARTAHDGWLARVAQVMAELETVRSALAAMVADVAEVRVEARRIEQDAAMCGYVIDDDRGRSGWGLHAGRSLPGNALTAAVNLDHSEADREPRWMQIDERIRVLRRRADRLDRALFAVLRRAVAAAMDLRVEMVMTDPLPVAVPLTGSGTTQPRSEVAPR
jgi:hypothetical protein